MLTNQIVHCPNCGGLSERRYFESDTCSTGTSARRAANTDAERAHRIVMQTRCRACDYAIAQCLNSGAVLECYAPGLRADVIKKQATPCTI